MRRARGFTLLEVLVVLVIVAAMAGLLVFAFNDSPQQRLRREASEFALLLNAVADEAVMRGVELGVAIDENGYRFVMFDPETKQWRAAIDRGLAAHKFPEPYTIDFSLDGAEIDQQALERAKLFAQRGTDEQSRPLILMLSSGEVTAFVLRLSVAGEKADTEQITNTVSLHSDGLNPVVVDRTSMPKDRS